MFGRDKKKQEQETPNEQDTGSENEMLRQDLSQKAQHTGVYIIRLLFREEVSMPESSALMDALTQRFGTIDTVADSPEMASYALTEHIVTYEDEKKAPSQILITKCSSVKNPIVDEMARSQFWDCPNGAELLDSCPWQVMASDFMAGGLPPLERADILADWLEILLELFPECEAVYFDASGKLLTAESCRDNPYTGPRRFIHGGVNARFFNIEGSDDHVVDTLGMYAFGLPDVQYHYHGLDANDVVSHAYNTVIYQFENDVPIESGHTIGGLEPDSKWLCQYEDSLIQPSRVVLDIAAAEFASGGRNNA